MIFRTLLANGDKLSQLVVAIFPEKSVEMAVLDSWEIEIVCRGFRKSWSSLRIRADFT